MKSLNKYLCLALLSSPALAYSQATVVKLIVVDQTEDSLDGNCARGAAAGKCNLRAAIAEGLKQGDATIQLSVPSKLTQGPIAVAPASAVKKALKLEAVGAQQSISGNTYARLLDVNQYGKIIFKNLLIQKFGGWDAGAILNSGSVELVDVLLKGNKASCSGVGAMTAFASCGGGAVTNNGTLTLKNVKFEKNEVAAQATTASYTTANGWGGAIQNGGTLVFDGKVTFDGNRAYALAASGYHPMPFAGANANATGGAIHSFNGTLVVKPQAVGKCSFKNNEAKAEASKPADKQGEALAASRGGAVYANGGAFDLAAANCVFENNQAQLDPDYVYVPAP